MNKTDIINRLNEISLEIEDLQMDLKDSEGKCLQKIDVSDDRFGEMVNWAVRYRLLRKTHAPHSAIAFLRPLLPYLNIHTLWVMEQDISQAAVEQKLGRPEIDMPKWLEFLDEIREEMWKRNRGVEPDG